MQLDSLHQGGIAASVWRTRVAVVCLAFSVTFSVAAAPTNDVLRGVNFVHPLQFSTADQETKLAELQSLGVHVIRFGMYAQDENKDVDFIKRAYAHRISTVLILHGLYAPGAPERPYRPKEFPGMWPGPPLSALDPQRSRNYFQGLMDRLEASGIALAGLELENEINMAGNDPDFVLPGEGRVLGQDDLLHDPEGQQVARGYLQYLKVLEVLKQVRDRLRLDRRSAVRSRPLRWRGRGGEARIELALSTCCKPARPGLRLRRAAPHSAVPSSEDI